MSAIAMFYELTLREAALFQTFIDLPYAQF
jgi:hypothetical protein